MKHLSLILMYISCILLIWSCFIPDFNSVMIMGTCALICMFIANILIKIYNKNH